MWPAALITAGAAAFGRLFVVGILPSAILTTILWLTIHAKAFDPDNSHMTLGNLVRTDAKLDTIGILLFLCVVALLAAMLQNFQIAAVRLLEGYWGKSRVSVAAFAAGVCRHQSRLRRAKDSRDAAESMMQAVSAAESAGDPGRLPEQWENKRALLRGRLLRQTAVATVHGYPPYERDLMPTRLGNALRSAERTSGERYGWITVDTWPRLYLTLPEPSAVPYRSAVDAVDAAAVFCLTFTATFAVTLAAFYNDPALLWVPILCATLSFMSYRGAVIAAMIQRKIQHTAFDLNRFELLEALHFKLPETPEEEYELV